MVRNNPCVVWLWFLSIKEWWAQVTVTPEARRIAVFKRGIWSGLKGWIPTGGHMAPISILGDKHLWKNAQKNEIKKKISETINKIIPHRNIKFTTRVWRPW